MQYLLALYCSEAEGLSLEPLVERLRYPGKMDAEQEHSDHCEEMQCDCDLIKDYNRAIAMLLSLRKHYKLHNKQNKADYVHRICQSKEQPVW